jgi:hypothetical protein
MHADTKWVSVLTVFFTRQLRERDTLVRQYMINVPEPFHELIVRHLHLQSYTQQHNAHHTAAYIDVKAKALLRACNPVFFMLGAEQPTVVYMCVKQVRWWQWLG